jgi:predicted transcriptional regulator
MRARNRCSILESQEGLERLFFELAGESRLGILRELQTKNLKMQEIARRLDLTATEAVRQLKRLTEALLIERQPEGSYAITGYGRLVLQLSASLEFAFKHRRFLLTHDIWRLPYQFLNRIGELSQANLMTDTMEGISRAEQVLREAEQYVWGFGEGRFTEAMNAIASEQTRKGLEYKILSPLPPAKIQNLENRTLSDIPAVLALTEKEAVVAFRLIGGRVDYAGFCGKDPTFLSWLKDLFLYYWDKGKR